MKKIMKFLINDVRKTKNRLNKFVFNLKNIKNN